MDRPNESKKNLLIAAGIFPPDIGGPATYAQTLCEELPGRGFKLKVIAYADAIAECGMRNAELPKKIKNDDPEIKIYKVWRNLNILLRYSYYFWAVFKLCDWADIVYAQGPVSEGLPAYLACKLKRKKYILKITGDYAWEQARQRSGVNDNLDEFQNKKYGWRTELMRWVEKLTARGAAKIIVPSRYLENMVKTWRIGDGKTEVIYNALAPMPAPLGREEARGKLNLNGKVVLTIGRLVPWKGIDALISAMPELSRVDSSFRLVIIGDGPLFADLKAKAKETGAGDKIIFTGRLKRERVNDYLVAADFFILNSGYEGLPHVLIEAMAAGLAVLASRTGGNVEVIKPGENGILFGYNNSDEIKSGILALAKDEKMARRLGEQAKISAGLFSRERMVEKTAEVLSKIL